MNTPIWKEIDEECRNCGGGDVEVFTDCKERNQVCDGDPIRCNECHATGMASVDEDSAYFNWNDDPPPSPPEKNHE